jgi:hypothetical protein
MASPVTEKAATILCSRTRPLADTVAILEAYFLDRLEEVEREVDELSPPKSPASAFLERK